ncbi:MAG: zinc-binding dehydrogenase [Actinomycetota bacterium]
MKAAAIESGERLEARVIEVSEPVARPGEVVVEMRAAALNHLDLWTLSGTLGIELDFPFILGADGAGVVASVGEGVPPDLVGKSVMINPGISCRVCESCSVGQQSECHHFQMLGEHRDGTLAERTTVPAENVHSYPSHLSFEEAAALGVTFITAYRMLFTKGRLRPGEWVLITGIGGGLALSLLQLAQRVAGKIFVTSSSGAKLDRAAELGADHGLDYTSQDIGKAVRALTQKRGVDLVVDSAAGDTLDASMRALRPGGRVVIAGATSGRHSSVDIRRLFGKQLEVCGSTMGSDADVAGMLRMVEGAGLRPIIDRVYPLSEVPDALDHLASGEQFGKVVISLDR